MGATLLQPAVSRCADFVQNQASTPIRFALHPIPFRLETDETLKAPHAPATMAGGVGVFDYNQDGRPDIFFTNGANIATLKKDKPKYSNRLFRNDGNGVFTDVTDRAGLAGTGYDIGVAIGDYDNDGYPDLFVAGVHSRALYHNNRDGTFSDVTVKAHLGGWNDAEHGPLWSVTAAWVDVNNDGLLDLFVVNYLRWNYEKEPLCGFAGAYDYCSPDFYRGQPNQLFLNRGDGTFEDVSAEWGIRQHVGKGMGVGIADYDLDGRPDLFVTNDTYFNFLFHHTGQKFEEVALEMGVGLIEDGEFVSGMGVDFRDINNDGYPDIVFPALQRQLFHIFQGTEGKRFEEITDKSGMELLSMPMSGYGVGLFDFDNDGWKDLFVSRGHVEMLSKPGMEIEQHNTVFRNLGKSGRWQALTEEAGLAAAPPKRHRGCAFGDFDGDGRIDVAVTALLQPAEIWINRSEGARHWLAIALEGAKSNRDGIGAVIKIVTQSGTQWNHMTTSVGYASSSHGPVHFGLGGDDKVEQVEIRWPSGIIQRLRNVSGDRVLRVKEAASP
ncbi:MAG: CRTAC1 family protein [Acidobacteria bacterium]|nr:MAG: CRTAC1 family protein [Acidobacteriota bacterium]